MFLAVLLGAALQTLHASPLTRVPNTTLRVPSTPPSLGYRLTNAFGNLAVADPVAIKAPPGETNRLFIVEQDGRISVITNLMAPNRTVFLDITGRVSGGVPTDERGLLGLAFHPGYATNGFFYVFYTGNATTPTPGGNNSLHDILSRFQVLAGNPNAANPNSELRLLLQNDEAGNHNAGDIHFGPDGYLYVAVGDEGGGNDTYNNSQTITKDFFAGILRIDVDKRPGNLPPNSHPAATTNYAVPADNPFVGATSFNGVTVNPQAVRTEFWAVGLRNPWRFSFDPATGLLYCADVGQNVWEEINIITRGGNYGWAYREGRHSGPKTAPGGFTSINPIFEYSHGTGTNQGYSVTGGVVYRGNRLPQLTGAYVFADYVSGNVWALRYDGSVASDFRRITTQGGIAGFGTDPSNGDVLIANQSLDTIQRLVHSTQVIGQPLPPTLAETGAFADLGDLAPHPGIVHYDLNVPFWSDGATKQRWFSIPNTNHTIGFNPEGNWSFPTGTVWIKHFDLELTNGVPESTRRLETRFLVKNALGVHGFTYRWGDSLTNALLVPEEGLDEPLTVVDGGGVVRTQVWHYPSRQECNICHTPQGGFALGFNTAQLNRPARYGAETTNQLLALSDAGYFNQMIEGTAGLPMLAHATNTAASLEFRVRSYLTANCAQCHQPGGVPQSLWDARFTTPTEQAGLVDGPLVDNHGNPELRVVRRGSIPHSELLARISTLGPGRMPPLASSVLDVQAIQLLSAWITNDLPNWQSFSEWQQATFGDVDGLQALPESDPDGDLTPNYLEYLAGTDATNAASLWRPKIVRRDGGVEVVLPQPANRAIQIQSAADLRSPVVWKVLEAPGNERFFVAAPTNRVVRDAISSSTNKYYRARLLAP